MLCIAKKPYNASLEAYFICLAAVVQTAVG